MSKLKRLIENGLCLIQEGKSYREWCGIMQQDAYWDENEEEMLTVDILWEICQYVIYTWDSEKEDSSRYEPKCSDRKIT